MELNDIKKVCFFDTETVGLRPNYIVSLAYRYYERGKKPVFGEIRCNPRYHISEGASQVNGFTDEMVKDWPTFEEEWENIKGYFTESLWIGHNTPYDASAIELEASRYGLIIPHHYMIDTLEISKKMIPKGTTKNYKLGTLCDFFDIKAEVENYHSADFDIWATDKLFRKLIKLNEESNGAYKKSFLPKEVDEKDFSVEEEEY